MGKQISLIVLNSGTIYTVSSLSEPVHSHQQPQKTGNGATEASVPPGLEMTMEQTAHCCIMQGTHPSSQTHRKQTQLMAGLVTHVKNLEFDTE